MLSDSYFIKDGKYLTTIKSYDFRVTLDAVTFIEIMLNVHVGEYELNTNPKNKYTSMDGIVKLHYRLPLTLGAFKKTYDQLVIMGATMKVNPEINEIDDIFDGVGSKEFYANVVTLECDENEAPGKYRTYVKSVESL